MSEGRSALITGVTGQDGWYLANSLAKSGYSVVGTTHRPLSEASSALSDLDIELISLDLSSMEQIEDLVRERQFDEIYNLAARASSAQLFDDALATADINGVAVARLLEAIVRHSPETRFCQASSSEVFAGGSQSTMDEHTSRVVRNAYGASKAFADHLVNAYREARGLYACSAILFSHESPRRPVHFLVRKVANAAARIASGEMEEVTLENLESLRDWGYALDYMEAMRRMLTLDRPRDYVVATGECHSVQEVCEIAFDHVGLHWRDYVRVSTRPTRDTEPDPRVGDASRAHRDLNWQPTIGFEELVVMIVDHDLGGHETAS